MATDVTWKITITAVESLMVAHNSTAIKMKEFLAKPGLHTK